MFTKIKSSLWFKILFIFIQNTNILPYGLTLFQFKYSMFLVIYFLENSNVEFLLINLK